MAEPAQIAALLVEVADIRTSTDQARLERTKALLTAPAVRDALVRQRLRRELTAERFNVFDILWLTASENHHSRFLAFLLDPMAAHDQGARFLRTFVTRLADLPHHGHGACDIPVGWAGWSEDDWRRCHVRLEDHTGAQGRIDVVLYLPDGAVIALENKVHAAEGDRQLARYRRWLNSLPNPFNAARLLLFLTPDGRDPTTADVGDPVRLMSYGDLAKVLRTALSDCPRTATPLIATVEQYINVCLSIHQGAPLMCELNDEIRDLLDQPEHLATALDIEQHLPSVKERIQVGFRRHFLTVLRQHLQNDPAQERWQAGSLPDWREAVGLLTRAHSRAAPSYACVVSIVFSGDIHGGWFRPRCGQLNEPVCQALEQRMRAAGLGEPGDWWLTVCYPREEVDSLRQPDFAPLLDWQRDNVLAIHADNQNPNHPLATSLAEWLWERFAPFREPVEHLPDF